MESGSGAGGRQRSGLVARAASGTHGELPLHGRDRLIAGTDLICETRLESGLTAIDTGLGVTNRLGCQTPKAGDQADELFVQLIDVGLDVRGEP